MNKKELLDKITTHYLNSGDFNGIPNYYLESYEANDLEELIREGSVKLLSEDRDINTHINRLNLFASIDEQVASINNGCNFNLYPTPTHLNTVQINEEKPFTKMLALGMEQLRVLYFNVEVLEYYFNDPRYTIQDYGYIGTVYINDDSVNEDDPIHSEYIKNFGTAYPSKGDLDSDRAIGVLLRDLSKLNLEAQYKWRGFLLPDQKAFRINGGFKKNMIWGDWVEEQWVFDVMLEELKFINTLCKNMEIPPLFNHEYSRESQDLIGYRIVLLPTLKNYYDFVGALEKIFVHNLNYKTFQKQTKIISPVERKNPDGTPKGSVILLEEWLEKNYYSRNPEGAKLFKEKVSSVLREIRKIRQIPAHELYENKHDKSVYKKQNELVTSLYYALQDIRAILLKHPNNRGVTIPTELNGDNVVIY